MQNAILPLFPAAGWAEPCSAGALLASRRTQCSSLQLRPPPGDGALAELTTCACMRCASCSDTKPLPNNEGNNKSTSSSVPLPKAPAAALFPPLALTRPAVAFHRPCFTNSLLSLGCAEGQLEITLKDLLQAMMNCLQMGRCPLQSR